jgi:hypothetical protein
VIACQTRRSGCTPVYNGLRPLMPPDSPDTNPATAALLVLREAAGGMVYLGVLLLIFTAPVFIALWSGDLRAICFMGAICLIAYFRQIPVSERFIKEADDAQRRGLWRGPTLVASKHLMLLIMGCVSAVAKLIFDIEAYFINDGVKGLMHGLRSFNWVGESWAVVLPIGLGVLAFLMGRSRDAIGLAGWGVLFLRSFYFWCCLYVLLCGGFLGGCCVSIGIADSDSSLERSCTSVVGEATGGVCSASDAGSAFVLSDVRPHTRGTDTLCCRRSVEKQISEAPRADCGCRSVDVLLVVACGWFGRRTHRSAPVGGWNG